MHFPHEDIFWVSLMIMYPVLCLAQRFSQLSFIIQELKIVPFGCPIAMELRETKLEYNIILHAYLIWVFYVLVFVVEIILSIKETLISLLGNICIIDIWSLSLSIWQFLIFTKQNF